MAEPKTVNNLEINPDKGHVLCSVNPKIYALDTIYTAGKVFLEHSFVIIDGDPEQEILVELRPKKSQDLEELGRDFNNELIRFAAGRVQPVKEAPVQETESCEPESVRSEQTPQEEMSYLDDPLGIARPWEEVYGQGADKK
jgi:hypothetical protein